MLKAIFSCWLEELAESCFILEDSFHGVKSAISVNCNVIMVHDDMESNEKIREILYKRCGSLKGVIDCIENIVR